MTIYSYVYRYKLLVGKWTAQLGNHRSFENVSMLFVNFIYGGSVPEIKLMST